ncbi:MAG: hypothetical protein KJO21_02650 [Verrucomicrobiae bacterium]|nr:hypothetical protein [Verrucomicrobiae bacterium]NNJ44199.1 hypothetical protein [Akkermansiaceae bacterium]
MNYPLNLSFKVIAIAPQIFVNDSQGSPICFVKQKLFKLREDIQVFSDPQKSRQIASIKANKVIDWSARYFFTDDDGHDIGSVGRQGMRSIWRARYDVFNPGDEIADFNIQEENPWTKVLDGFLGSIPLVGFLTGYFCHPAYIATRPDGTPVMRVQKQAAFFEGKFTIEKLAELAPQEEINLIYSFLMLLLLERARG